MSRILLLIFILLNFESFADESFDIDNPFQYFECQNLDEIIDYFGQPLTVNEFKEDERIYYYYKGLRISLYFSDDNFKPLISVIIMDPTIKLFDRIKVGDMLSDLIDLLGEPDDKNNDFLTYFGNDHYILFFYDQYGQINRINWSYFMD